MAVAVAVVVTEKSKVLFGISIHFEAFKFLQNHGYKQTKYKLNLTHTLTNTK